MNQVISGALTMGYLVATLFFIRYWHRSRDRLFVFFALAFFILAVQRVALEAFSEKMEDSTLFYVLRLLAFLIILFGILDKNRKERPGVN
jgi:hypothetical protein